VPLTGDLARTSPRGTVVTVMYPHNDGDNKERVDVVHLPIGCQLCCDATKIVPSLGFRNEGVAFNKTCGRRQHVFNKAGY
jgi:hypothetical protein